MTDAVVKDRPVVGGLVGYVLDKVRRGRNGLSRPKVARTLKLVETLPLGGKRRLMLVTCEGRRFLVGAGEEGVQTIVAVDGDEVEL